MVYHLLLGGNVGDVDETMSRAIDSIAEAGHVVRISNTYVSPPWGFQSELPFHNLVVELVSDVDPFSLLNFLKHLEVTLGRKTKTRKDGAYSDRPIDIDILFAGQKVVNTEVLCIPHPRLHLRRFTLVPLAEIAPDLFHPVLRQTVSQLLEDCPDQAQVFKL